MPKRDLKTEENSRIVSLSETLIKNLVEKFQDYKFIGKTVESKKEAIFRPTEQKIH